MVPSKFVFVSLPVYTGCPWLATETYDSTDTAKGAPPAPREAKYPEVLPWSESDLGRKPIPSAFKANFCLRQTEKAMETANEQTSKERAAAMAALWVRQLRWAWHNIPEDIRAAEDVLKIVAWPEWTFRAVPGTEPLSNADVVTIRVLVQKELTRLDKAKKPIYANFLIVAGTFYYGAQVAPSFLRPVKMLENRELCGVGEPKDGETGKRYFGRREWVEPASPNGANPNRAWAMFNCADVYYINPTFLTGNFGQKGYLQGPFIRCKSRQADLARQKHPYREVWGRCAVVDAANNNRRIEEAFDGDAAIFPVKYAAELERSAEKPVAAVNSLNKTRIELSEIREKLSKNDQFSTDNLRLREKELILEEKRLMRESNKIAHECLRLSRAVENSRWPFLGDFEADPFLIVGSLRIALDICADHGESALRAEKKVKGKVFALPAGSGGSSKADLYFLISNGMMIEDMEHVTPHGYVLRVDGNGMIRKDDTDNLYLRAKDGYLSIKETTVKHESPSPAPTPGFSGPAPTRGSSLPMALPDNFPAGFCRSILSKQITWGYFFLDRTMRLPSHPESALKVAKIRVQRYIKTARILCHTDKGKVVAFLESTRAVVFDRPDRKWGRSFFASLFRKAKLTTLIICEQTDERQQKHQYFLEQHDPKRPNSPAVWRLLPVESDMRVPQMQPKTQGVAMAPIATTRLVEQAMPCRSFTSLHPDLSPWVFDGCGKRKPCICIALEEHTSSLAAHTDVPPPQTRVMRAVIDDRTEAGADFLLLLRSFTARPIDDSSLSPRASAAYF